MNTAIACSHFNTQIAFIKKDAKRLRKIGGKSRPHKFYLNFLARQLGHDSYDHLQNAYRAACHQEFNQPRITCSTRCFEARRHYFYVDLHDEEYRYYSHWVGYDAEGYELRAPSLVSPEFFVKLVRESMRQPLYIIHTEEELCLWMLAWKGKALIDTVLAEAGCMSLPTKGIRSYSHGRLPESERFLP